METIFTIPFLAFFAIELLALMAKCYIENNRMTHTIIGKFVDIVLRFVVMAMIGLFLVVSAIGISEQVGKPLIKVKTHQQENNANQ